MVECERCGVDEDDVEYLVETDLGPLCLVCESWMDEHGVFDDPPERTERRRLD